MFWNRHHYPVLAPLLHIRSSLILPRSCFLLSSDRVCSMLAITPSPPGEPLARSRSTVSVVETPKIGSNQAKTFQACSWCTKSNRQVCSKSRALIACFQHSTKTNSTLNILWVYQNCAHNWYVKRRYSTRDILSSVRFECSDSSL